MKNKSNPHPKQKSTAKTKSKRTWLIPVVVILSAVAGVIFWMNRNVIQPNKSTSTPPTQVQQPMADQNQLVGRWVRTDSGGNYIIEIKSVAADGKLDASYLNPYPIKVGRTEWQKKNGSLMIVVELRDVNYPGSIYTLNLLSGGNRLAGNYYQAVEGTNFDVEFVRM
jgi:hypothetical protein